MIDYKGAADNVIRYLATMGKRSATIEEINNKCFGGLADETRLSIVIGLMLGQKSVEQCVYEGGVVGYKLGDNWTDYIVTK